MTWAVGQIVVGLLLLAVGGEVLLRGAVGLATLCRLAPSVIGLTVVAAGTSVPELAVSLLAAHEGRTDVTVGNVVGSNLFNITFIIGLAALVRPPSIEGGTVSLEYPVLLLVTLAFTALADDGIVSRLDGVFLVFTYVGLTVYLVSLVRNRLTADEKREFGAETQALAPPAPRPWVRNVALVVGGVALLATGADRTVAGAVAIGQRFGMSDRLIGLTIVGIGTGLPEIVTSVLASLRGRTDVAVGNVIGSNLFNLLGILGLAAIVRPLPVDPVILASDRWWLLAVTAGVFPILLRGRRVDRWEGIILLSVYGLYLAALVWTV